MSYYILLYILIGLLLVLIYNRKVEYQYDTLTDYTFMLCIMVWPLVVLTILLDLLSDLNRSSR